MLPVPEAIAAVHRAYLDAGADCITTASYQGTVEGFRRVGTTTAEAEGLLAHRDAVEVRFADDAAPEEAR